MSNLTFHQIASGVDYACHPDHRNGSPHKSQWTITETHEIQSFTNTHNRGWAVGSRAWGLHYENDQLGYIGMAADGCRRLFVARFEDGSANGKWHGYPADHQNKPNDRLPESLKRIWISERILPPAKVRKLSKGEPCSL